MDRINPEEQKGLNEMKVEKELQERIDFLTKELEKSELTLTDNDRKLHFHSLRSNFSLLRIFTNEIVKTSLF
jgi:hypothetical protein